jgi:hypothetical protein
MLPQSVFPSYSHHSITIMGCKAVGISQRAQVLTFLEAKLPMNQTESTIALSHQAESDSKKLKGIITLTLIMCCRTPFLRTSLGMVGQHF